MANTTLQVTVPKELNDVLAALEALVIAAKAGTVSLDAEVAAFLPLIGELNAALSEIKAQPFDASRSALLHGLNVVQALLS